MKRKEWNVLLGLLFKEAFVGGGTWCMMKMVPCDGCVVVLEMGKLTWIAWTGMSHVMCVETLINEEFWRVVFFQNLYKWSCFLHVQVCVHGWGVISWSINLKPPLLPPHCGASGIVPVHCREDFSAEGFTGWNIEEQELFSLTAGPGSRSTSYGLQSTQQLLAIPAGTDKSVVCALIITLRGNGSWLSTCSSWACRSGEAGLGDLRRSPKPQWFCDWKSELQVVLWWILEQGQVGWDLEIFCESSESSVLMNFRLSFMRPVINRCHPFYYLQHWFYLCETEVFMRLLDSSCNLSPVLKPKWSTFRAHWATLHFCSWRNASLLTWECACCLLVSFCVSWGYFTILQGLKLDGTILNKSAELLVVFSLVCVLPTWANHVAMVYQILTWK